jgi:hypothetical protein
VNLLCRRTTAEILSNSTSRIVETNERSVETVHVCWEFAPMPALLGPIIGVIQWLGRKQKCSGLFARICPTPTEGEKSQAEKCSATRRETIPAQKAVQLYGPGRQWKVSHAGDVIQLRV